MPNGIFPVPPGSSGLASRLKTWAQRDRLDDQLARAVDPGRTPELQRRAARLTSATERARLAESLERVVREAGRKPVPFTVALTVRRAEVRALADDLLVLARRLQADDPVDVRGVAMVSRLLHDGAGPLYEAAARLSLEHAVRSARLALDPTAPLQEARPIAA